MSPKACSRNLRNLLLGYNLPLSSPWRFLDDGCAAAVVVPPGYPWLSPTWRRTVSRNHGDLLSTERQTTDPMLDDMLAALTFPLDPDPEKVDMN
jgi:hypothetical protein